MTTSEFKEGVCFRSYFDFDESFQSYQNEMNHKFKAKKSHCIDPLVKKSKKFSKLSDEEFESRVQLRHKEIETLKYSAKEFCCQTFDINYKENATEGNFNSSANVDV